MKIEKVIIKNFKCYAGPFELKLDSGVNIIVGNNEAGKSTILEAINLALTGLLNGRPLRNELSNYIFNNSVTKKYLDSLKTSTPMYPPPEVLIEIYFSGDDPEYAEFEGDGTSDGNRASGVAYRVYFDEVSYKSSYEALMKTGELKSIPVEYYTTQITSFARSGVVPRNIPLKPAFIDSASSRLQNGSDVYISRIVREFLEEDERAAISQVHRRLRETFMADASLQPINDKITNTAKISNKSVSISVDLSSHMAWEGGLMTFIDEVPFHYIGKGEQSTIKAKLALSRKKSSSASVLLIEEPENHLSHSRLNQLVRDVRENHEDKQIIISTHSSFVANKLGLDHLLLLRDSRVVSLKGLESNEFFKKLAGYDTLRLILAKKAILVEGDSDELVVQRAYMDANNGRLPIEDDIEVISVGTSFLRFLEIATKLELPVAVVTDNDGDVAAVDKKYAAYASKSCVKLCFDRDVDAGSLMIGTKQYNYNTLEPKLLKANSREALCKVFGTSCATEDDLHKYMRANKTDCALAIFSTKEPITFPSYILDAIAI